MIIGDHDGGAGLGGDDPTGVITKGEEDTKALALIVMPTVTGDTGGEDDVSGGKVDRTRAIEEKDFPLSLEKVLSILFGGHCPLSSPFPPLRGAGLGGRGLCGGVGGSGATMDSSLTLSISDSLKTIFLFPLIPLPFTLNTTDTRKDRTRIRGA